MTLPNQPQMQMTTSADSLTSWLLQRGLEGINHEDLLHGYCTRLVELGVPLLRLHLAQSAFHPIYGGIGFNWWREDGVSSESYARSEAPRDAWLNSPLYHLIESPDVELREPILGPNEPSRFPLLNELKEKGATDYFATKVLLERLEEGYEVDPNKTPEGLLMSWVSDAPNGFSDANLQVIRDALPALALALKSASNRRMADDLLQVYLGRDAGRRVLSGEIQRGSLQQIDAVLCYFDLQDFTSLTERTPGPDLIDMLNDYFGLAVGVIQGHGGNILKFLGDGILAMFNLETFSASVTAALDAVAELRAHMEQLTKAREENGGITTSATFALHAGEIFYGNIGAENRLDFTVIGPAVNLTVRLSGLHRSVGQNVILSDIVAGAAGDTRHDIVSVGRIMVRGVSEPQELFTIYQGAPEPR